MVLTRQTCGPSGEERNGLLLSTEWDGRLMKISGCITINVIGTDDATSETQRKGSEQLIMVVCSNWWDGTGTECGNCRRHCVSIVPLYRTWEVWELNNNQLDELMTMILTWDGSA